jgi:hypothetical protein
MRKLDGPWWRGTSVPVLFILFLFREKGRRWRCEDQCRRGPVELDGNRGRINWNIFVRERYCGGLWIERWRERE